VKPGTAIGRFWDATRCLCDQIDITATTDSEKKIELSIRLNIPADVILVPFFKDAYQTTQ
jgi:hypothetical protein